MGCTGEAAEWLTAFTTLAEKPSLVLSTQAGCLTAYIKDPGHLPSLLACVFAALPRIKTHAYTHNLKIRITSLKENQ